MDNHKLKKIIFEKTNLELFNEVLIIILIIIPT